MDPRLKASLSHQIPLSSAADYSGPVSCLAVWHMVLYYLWGTPPCAAPLAGSHREAQHLCQLADDHRPIRHPAGHRPAALRLAAGAFSALLAGALLPTSPSATALMPAVSPPAAHKPIGTSGCGAPVFGVSILWHHGMGMVRRRWEKCWQRVQITTEFSGQGGEA
eukprot:CAMPEP_0119320646 /NCGR_PEP_ID=MMETSP1333-20130426/53009_1 /TAXON_ID=418940 /ORGANISM="Scyphosphaera apsteinii, Strain RCC1455" /LENGTH=164 /DNA_ID=CAMNT_0007327409 /DNA_START=502 /DNA_END=997 /DNA_ORIENTATION=+